MNQYPADVSADSSFLFPLAGLLLVFIAACTYLYFSRRERAAEWIATLVWLMPSAMLLLILAVLCGMNLYISYRECLIATVALVTCSGCFTLLRTKVANDLDDMSRKAAIFMVIARDAFILLFAAGTSFLVLELPWNDQLLALVPNYLIPNLIVLVVVHAAAYFLCGRRGVLSGVVVLGCMVIGLMQYFVGMFKGSAIVPSDVLAAGTALSVSGGYDYTFGAAQTLVFGLAALAIALLSFVRPVGFVNLPLKQRVKQFGVSLGIGVAVCVAFCCCFASVSFSDDLGFSRGYWNALVVYRQQGFLGSFISLAQNAQIKTPEGYTQEKAESVLESRVSRYQEHFGATDNRESAEKQFEEVKPTVIAVMNESFSDFSFYDGLGVGYEGPARFKGVGDALYTGYVYSSVIGGGTCNSEFEFLTGASMGFVGTQNQPYMMHNLSEVDSLSRQFDELGYSTTAIHPNIAMNWNRDVAYPQIGFGQFLDIESFPSDAPVRHMGVTDQVTYDKILELLGSNDSPQFIFDVTMQNHSGYEVWDLSDDDRLDYDLGWLNAQFADQSLAVGDQVMEYISLIETSDRDLSTFLDELRALDRPVVVVFFGDHQPWFGSTLNSLQFSDYDQNDPSMFERIYATPYMIWANYDVAGNDQTSQRRDLGISSLAALLNYSIGTPLTDWQMAQMDIMQEVPVINGFGYQTVDGAWHLLGDDSDASTAVRDLEWIQYLEYASKI